MADSATSFWGSPSVEPKRAYRFIVEVPGLDNAAWYASKVGKPGFSVSESEHTFLNHKFYYPGRVEWEEVSMTLVDPITPDATDQLMSMLGVTTKNGGGASLTGEMGYRYPDTYDAAAGTTITKLAATTALGEVVIKQISGDTTTAPYTSTTIVEQWVLKRAWIKSVDFGELDYTSDDLINIELTIRYDWAVINADDSEVGQALVTSA